MSKKFDVLASATPEAISSAASKALLVGEVVFTSLRNVVPKGFVQQSQIETNNNVFDQLAKKSSKVFVSVDERLFAAPKSRFAIAVESYIGWGLRRGKKGTTILFGGVVSENRTFVSIIVVAEGVVVEVDDRVLPAQSESFFRETLLSLIADYRAKYPASQMFQASPLNDWAVPEVSFIGDKALGAISYRPLSRGYSSTSAFLLPAAICIVGLLFYFGALGTGWGKYSTAVSNYETAIDDPAIKAQGGIDTNFLDVVQARRVYMSDPRRQSALAEKAASIVRGIGAVEDVKILELRLPAPSINLQAQPGLTISPAQARLKQTITPERVPDVKLQISVPKSQVPALDQALATMTVVANATAMSLRLSHEGWREEQGRRIYNIEGFIHD